MQPVTFNIYNTIHMTATKENAKPHIGGKTIKKT
jgi:hypothetical protein